MLDLRRAFPPPADRRIAVRVRPDALRRLRAGHPWVFDGSITSTSDDGSPGDLAVVFDDRRRFVAIGLWDPTSPIRIRVLQHRTPVTVDDGLWRARVHAALARRAELLDDPATTGYRLLNGENDAVPGLVADRYADVVVCKVYSTAWLPHLAGVVDALVDAVAPTTVLVRVARRIAGDVAPLRDATVVHGAAADDVVEFAEHGVVFGADVVAGQKTGHFLDQRENRVAAARLATGVDVLDVFCCTGGFSVHAAAAGAASVTSVDLSAPALRNAVANMGRNASRPAVADCEHRTMAGDAFEVLDRLAAERRRFGLVIVDPPSFASSADAVPRALRSYRRLTEAAVRVCEPGGFLVQSSCSSRVDGEALATAMREGAQGADRALTGWTSAGHAIDHPVTFPEGHYLDTWTVRVADRGAPSPRGVTPRGRSPRGGRRR